MHLNWSASLGLTSFFSFQSCQTMWISDLVRDASSSFKIPGLSPTSSHATWKNGHTQFMLKRPAIKSVHRWMDGYTKCGLYMQGTIIQTLKGRQF